MDIGGIGALVTGQSSSALQQQVGIAVLGKALDSQQENAQSLVQMMERSVQPHLGGSIDIRM